MDLIPADAVVQLKRSISAKRFNHCLGVLQTAIRLADAWHPRFIHRTNLAWAALFHDCAKELPREESQQLLQDHPIVYGRELLDTPSLVHAPLGAVLLPLRYGMDHPDVLKAVAYHPTGHPSLTSIGWAVYMADYLEPGRTFFPDREFILENALKDPLLGLRQVTDLRLRSVRQKGKPVNPAVLVFKDYLDTIESLDMCAETSDRILALKHKKCSHVSR